MKILLQWSKATPEDWATLDLGATGAAANRWRNLPKKPLPAGGEVIDNTLGWLYDLCIDGVMLGGYDHYSAAPVTVSGAAGVEVTLWNDDPEDWPAGTRHALVWRFLPPAPDIRFGGRVNTRQWLTYFIEPNAPQADRAGTGETSGGPVVWRTWAEFVPPAATLTIHGVWLDATLEAQHLAVRRRLVDWREWVV